MVNLDSYLPASLTGVITTPFINTFNGLSVATQAWVMFMAVDFIMGSWNAHLKGEFKMKKLTNGFVTKLITYGGILIIAYYVAALSKADIVNTLAMGVMLSKEGLSVVSHSVDMGIFKKAELGWLQEALERLGGKKED